MGKRLNESPVTTRNARAGLRSGVVHWRGLDPDVHLGYRKSKRGGAWIVRWREGAGYRQAPLGTADDIFEGDGVIALTFAQAVAAARAKVAKDRAEAKASKEGPAPTVRMASESYLSAFEGRQREECRKVTGETRSRFNSHVFSDEAIADLMLHEIGVNDLINWKRRIRAKDVQETTVRRICNDFRAALNFAPVEFRSRLPVGYAETIRDGFKILTEDPKAKSERPNIILDDEEVSLVLKTSAIIDEEQDWGGDLHRLVVGLAASGSRFSQLIRVPVADLQSFTQRLVIPSSHKGRSNGARPPASAPLLAEELALLKEGARGRPGNEPLFMTWGYRRAGGIKWEKDKRRPWKERELTKPFREIVARAQLSPEVTAYALRHSSVARYLRQGLPVRWVAALHDTSSAMIELYYSKFITDAFDKIAAEARVPLLTKD